MFETLDSKFDVEHEEPSITDIVAICQCCGKAGCFGECESPSVIDADTKIAREALQGLITKGSNAVDEILNIARQSEHPRAYEVAGQFIKTVSEVAKDLLVLQKIQKELETVATPKIGTQNNIFTGSTAELLKALGKRSIEATAEIVEPESSK